MHEGPFNRGSEGKPEPLPVSEADWQFGFVQELCFLILCPWGFQSRDKSIHGRVHIHCLIQSIKYILQSNHVCLQFSRSFSRPNECRGGPFSEDVVFCYLLLWRTDKSKIQIHSAGFHQYSRRYNLASLYFVPLIRKGQNITEVFEKISAPQGCATEVPYIQIEIKDSKQPQGLDHSPVGLSLLNNCPFWLKTLNVLKIW